MNFQRNKELIMSKFGDTDFFETKNSYNPHLVYNCPFCAEKRGKPDLDHKLYVSIKKLKFLCFKCKSHGKIAYGIEDESNDTVYSKLNSYYGMNDTDFITDSEDDDNTFYVENIKIPKNTLAYEYLNKRGITDEMIDFYNLRFGVGYNYGRIVIPNEIYGEDGVWTDMFTSRTYIDQIPKYKNPDGCKKSNSVFNLHRQSEGGDCYVVEGPITAICAGKDAVCIYGSSPSNDQLMAILNKHFRNIYCVLDGDSSGMIGNAKLIDNLYKMNTDNNTIIWSVLMPEGIDAADIGEEKFKRYVHRNKILHTSDVYEKLIKYENKN